MDISHNLGEKMMLNLQVMNEELRAMLRSLLTVKSSEDAEHEISKIVCRLRLYDAGYGDSGARERIKKAKEEGVLTAVHNNLSVLEDFVAFLAKTYMENADVQAVCIKFQRYLYMLSAFRKIQYTQLIDNCYAPVFEKMDKSLESFILKCKEACDIECVGASIGRIKKGLSSSQVILDEIRKESNAIKNEYVECKAQRNFASDERYEQYMKRVMQCRLEIYDARKKLLNKFSDIKLNEVCDRVEAICKTWSVEAIQKLVHAGDIRLTELSRIFEELKQVLEQAAKQAVEQGIVTGSFTYQRKEAALRNIVEVLRVITLDELIANVEKCGAWVLENRDKILSDQLTKEQMLGFHNQEQMFDTLRTKIAFFSLPKTSHVIILKVAQVFQTMHDDINAKHYAPIIADIERSRAELETAMQVLQADMKSETKISTRDGVETQLMAVQNQVQRLDRGEHYGRIGQEAMKFYGGMSRHFVQIHADYVAESAVALRALCNMKQTLMERLDHIKEKQAGVDEADTRESVTSTAAPVRIAEREEQIEVNDEEGEDAWVLCGESASTAVSAEPTTRLDGITFFTCKHSARDEQAKSTRLNAS